jgi:hypothetical protein
MRKSLLLFLLLLVGIVLCLWYYTHKPQYPTPGEQARMADSSSNSPALPQQKQGRRTQPNAAGFSEPVLPGSNPAGWVEKRIATIEQEKSDTLSQWRAPIDFYGKVLDDHDQPIAGALVHFEWNDLSEKGTSEEQTLSDPQGVFSLTWKSGKGMSLTITKQGYYTPEESRYPSFEYGDPYGHFQPDSTKPVVFHLRKKGVAAPLIRFRKSFDVAKDDTPLIIDLATGSLARTGESALQVQCQTYDQGRLPGEKFTWKCTVSVPGGGIQASMEEFPFMAPESGYQTAAEINMPADSQAWRMDVQQDYFIRTADGRFGRILFRMIAHGEHFCLIESYFNPAGSRNLEFDPSLAVVPANK